MNDEAKKTMTKAIEQTIALAGHATMMVEEHDGSDEADAALARALGLLREHARTIDEAFRLHVGATRLLRERENLPRPKLLSETSKRSS